MSITLSGTDGVDQSSISGATTIPRGTTAERPANPVDGMIRYNTDESYIEYYHGDQEVWLPTSDAESPVQATGGTVTDITHDGVNYRVHTFTTVGTSSFQVTQGGEVDVLVVAGGGAGGADDGIGGAAGGGAGGLILKQGHTLFNDTYSVVVGDGGASVSGNQRGNNGDVSSFDGLEAIGGGGGGHRDTDNEKGADGGSGGGSKEGERSTGLQPLASGDSGTFGFGNGGGRVVSDGSFNARGGGGGGAGEAGEDQTSSTTGKGGDGLEITGFGDGIGENQFFAGGGGRGGQESGGGDDGSMPGGLGGGGDGALGTTASGESGNVNTGGGGGGTRAGTSGAGGSGIVIIRYPIRYPI